MKNIERKLVFIILVALLLIFTNVINCYAASVENQSLEVKVNSTVNYVINFQEKLTAIDLTITFDEDKLEFIEIETEKTDFNLIEDGKMIVVYSDETGVGTDNVSMLFKAKEKTTVDTKIKVESLNAYSIESNREYESADFNLNQLTESIRIKENSEREEEPKENETPVENQTPNENKTQEENTTPNKDQTPSDSSKQNNSNNQNNNQNKNSNTAQTNTINNRSQKDSGKLPQTGPNRIFIMVFIVAVILAIMSYKKMKGKSVVVTLSIGIIVLIAIEAIATTEIFARKYENTKNFTRIVVVMPDKINRNVSKKDFEQEINDSLEVTEIVNSNDEEIEDTDLIKTGDKTLTEDKEYQIIVYGDINADGNVNSIDIGLIIKELIKADRIENIFRKAANVSNLNDEDDENLDSKDIARLKEYILQRLENNLVIELPKECPESITLNPSSLLLNLENKKEGTITVEFTPDTAENKEISWASSDENIAIVDENGKVSAKAIGSATITARTSNGKEAECAVLVEPASMAVSVEEYVGDYDGNPHTIELNVTSPLTGVTIYYSATEELTDENYTQGSNVKPTRTDAGITTVYYYITAENYSSIKGSSIIKINKKKLNVPTLKTKAYTGEECEVESEDSDNPISEEIYEITGTTKATDEGTYEITLTPKSNYIWSDGTTDPKTITWTIVALDVVEFTSNSYNGEFDGNPHTIELNVTNPSTGATIYYSTSTELTEANYIEGSTNKPSRTNAGTTIVYFYIVAPDHVAAKGSGSITISKKKLDVPTLVNKFYTGEEQTVESTEDDNPIDENIYEISGTTKATDVGTYGITITPKANYMWRDGTTGSKTLSWKIEACEEAEYTSSNYTGEYDGNSHTIELNVTKPTTGVTVYYSTTEVLTEENYTQGTTTKPIRKNVGTTTVYFYITSTNYLPVSGSNTIKVERKKLEEPVLKNKKYTGEEITAESENATSISDTLFTIEGTTKATEIGIYEVTLTPKSNYSWSDGTRTAKTFIWEISGTIIEVRAEDYIGEYDGKYHTISFEVIEPTEGAVVYYSAVELTDDNFNLIGSDEIPERKGAGTTKVYYYVVANEAAPVKGYKTITITKKALTPPTLLNKAYTGSQQSAESDNSSNPINETRYTISGDRYATEPGTYTLILTPKSNYFWNDETETSKNFNWEIIAGNITANAFDYEGEYDAQNHTIALNVTQPTSGVTIYYSTTQELTDNNYTTGSTEKPYRKDVGETTVYYYIKANGCTPVTGNKKITITPKVLDVPILLNQKYTGEELTAASEDPHNSIYNSARYTIAEESVIKATNAGIYNVILTPTSNYTWTDGTRDTKTITWTIATDVIEITASDYEGEYDGNNHTIELTVTKPAEGATVYYATSRLTASNYLTNGSIDKPQRTGAGTTTVYYYVVAENYEPLSGSRTISISKKKLNVPVAKEKTYTGEEQTLEGIDTNNAINTYRYTIEGITTATNAGIYEVVLTPKSNYMWSDETTTSKTITWTINKATMEYAASGVNVEYDAQYHSISVEVTKPVEGATIYYSATEELTEINYTQGSTTNIRRRDARTTLVYFYIVADNYEAASGSKSIVIEPKVLYVPTLQNKVYNGNTQRAASADSSNYINSARYVIEGDYEKKDAGDYVLSLTPTSNYKWSNGTVDTVQLNWKITRKPLTVPLLKDKSYNEQQQSAESTDSSNPINDVRYTITGDRYATNAGTYEVTLTPTSNYMWDDESTNPVTLTWKIKKISMEVSVYSYFGEYDADSHTIDIEVTIPASGAEIYYSTTMALTDDNYTEGTTIKPTRDIAGVTTIYFYITNMNYNSVSGSTTITITPKVLTIPEGLIDKTYTGGLRKAESTDSNNPVNTFRYDIQGDYEVKDAGKHIIKITPTDNYIWDDGTRTPVEMQWNIKKKEITISAKPQTISYQSNVAIGTNMVTSSGIVSGQTISSINIVPTTTTYSTGKVVPLGAVITSDTEDETKNYSIKYNTAALTVTGGKTKADVTVDNDLIRISRNYDERSVRADYKDNNYIPWAVGSASPSIVQMGDIIYFYFRGEGYKNDDSADMYVSLPYVCTFDTSKGEVFDGTNFHTYYNEPLFNLGEGKAPDNCQITALATCEKDGIIYMFYMAKCYTVDDEGKEKYEYSLMYATSTDGIHFEKQGKPKKAPANVLSVYNLNGTIYATCTGYVNNAVDGNGYITTFDPQTNSFASDGKKQILTHDEHGWCSNVLDTFRMFDDGTYMYIFYGGHFHYNDYPEGFGIARAPINSDLTDPDNWEKYNYGPIMLRGASGAADEGAAWSFTVFKNSENKLLCFYEGYGSGTLESGQGSEDSIKIRSTGYGLQRDKAFSTVMVCGLDTNDLQALWDKEPLTGDVKIKNVGTGKFVTYNSNNVVSTTNSQDENTTLKLEFQNNFFRIKNKSNLYIAPEENTNTEDDERDFLATSTASFNLVTISSDYYKKRGMEWELYPVAKDTYKIQNRWTGCFLNMDNTGRIYQSQETNEDTMLWKITTAYPEGIYDVVLFWGQSNMVGYCGNKSGEDVSSNRFNVNDSNSINAFSNKTGISTDILQNERAMNYVAVPQTSKTVYEYKYLNGGNLEEITANTKTFGEKLRFNVTNRSEFIDATNDSVYSIINSCGTNMIPQFCKTYYEQTGHKVIAVFAANPGKAIISFVKGIRDLDNTTPGYYIYESMALKYSSAISYLENHNVNIGNKLWVCYQGENDAGTGTTASDYQQRFESIANDLRTDLGINKGVIVKSGGMLGTSNYGTTNGTTKIIGINNARDQIVSNSNGNIVIGSDYPFRYTVPNSSSYQSSSYAGVINSSNYQNDVNQAYLTRCLPYDEASTTSLNLEEDVSNTIHLSSAALCQVGKECAIAAANIFN